MSGLAFQSELLRSTEMKHFRSTAISLFLFFLLVDLSSQIPELRDCPPDFMNPTSPLADTCGILTCHDDGSFSEISCATQNCPPNKQQKYIEADNSKLFPDCCEGPICEE